MSFLGNIISKLTPSLKNNTFMSTRDLIKMESKIGGQLFGPVPEGHRREFFCLDDHTWVWYEEIIDSNTGQSTSITTRYEVRGDRIIKIQDGQPHQYTSLPEAKNLLDAVRLYYTQVAKQIYNKQIA